MCVRLASICRFSCREWACFTAFFLVVRLHWAGLHSITAVLLLRHKKLHRKKQKQNQKQKKKIIIKNYVEIERSSLFRLPGNLGSSSCFYSLCMAAVVAYGMWHAKFYAFLWAFVLTRIYSYFSLTQLYIFLLLLSNGVLIEWSGRIAAEI